LPGGRFSITETTCANMCATTLRLEVQAMCGPCSGLERVFVGHVQALYVCLWARFGP
jgi:hypothetical protein